MSRRAGFDFDYWANLAKQDPAGFEVQRTQYLQDAIERSSPRRRRRLEGLQFQLDLERRRAKTPMAACLKFSELMMNSLHDELLPLLNGVASGSVNAVLQRARESTNQLARVIPFRRSHHGQSKTDDRPDS